MRYAALLATLAAVSLHSTAVRAQAIQWGPAPANLPAGAKLAVLQGDPSKDGLFTIRLDMPDGYKIPPHFHPTDENVTVVEGTFLVGMGDKLDPAQTTALPAGGFVTAGAGTAPLRHRQATHRGASARDGTVCADLRESGRRSNNEEDFVILTLAGAGFRTPRQWSPTQG